MEMATPAEILATNSDKEDSTIMEDADEEEEEEEEDFYDDDDIDVDDDDGLASWSDDEVFGPNVSVELARTSSSSSEEPESTFALDLFRENWVNDIGDAVASKLIAQDMVQAIELIDKCHESRAHVSDLGSALAPHLAALPYEVWFQLFDTIDITSVVRLGLTGCGGHAAAWRYIDQVTEKWVLGAEDHTVVARSRVKEGTRVLRIQGDKAAMVSPCGPRPMPNVVLSMVPEGVEHLIVHDVSVRFSTDSHALPRFAGVVCMDLRSSKCKAMRFPKGSHKYPRRLEDCLYYFAGNVRDMPRLRRIRGVLVLRSREYKLDATGAERRSKKRRTDTFIVETRVWTVDRDKGTTFADFNKTYHAIGPSTTGYDSLVPYGGDGIARVYYIDSDNEHVDDADKWWHGAV